jgi:molybdate/tungstate transport system permease protein
VSAHAYRPRPAQRAASAGVVLGALVLLALLLLPILALLRRGGLAGLAQLGADPVLRASLLLPFGRATPAGAALGKLGLAIVGSATGIVLAMLFVAAPLYVGAAREAIARVDERYESVARTLGDSALRAAWRVTRPLSARGLLAAAVAMWARAASEFGAIVILTYNPKVASVLSYDRFTTGGLDAALPVAAVLVLLALVPLLVLRSLRASVAVGEPAR